MARTGVESPPWRPFHARRTRQCPQSPATPLCSDARGRPVPLQAALDLPGKSAQKIHTSARQHGAPATLGNAKVPCCAASVMFCREQTLPGSRIQRTGRRRLGRRSPSREVGTSQRFRIQRQNPPDRARRGLNWRVTPEGGTLPGELLSLFFLLLAPGLLALLAFFSFFSPQRRRPRTGSAASATVQVGEHSRPGRGRWKRHERHGNS